MRPSRIAAVAVVAAVALLAVAPVAPVHATTGLDLSSACYDSCFSCLAGEGYSFAVPRIYMSTGEPDPTGPHTIYNAWAGGMAHVDGYMFPCPTCGDPQGQMAAAVNTLRNYNCKFGMIWLDIEGPQYWMGQQANADFFAGLVSQAQAMGVVLGVYTSASQWEPIMGGYTGGSGFPLWYAHYDGNPSFADFAPFGGWSRPAIKQYSGDASSCGLDLDQDWYPDGLASGAPNMTLWREQWPAAFAVPNALADLQKPLVKPVAAAAATPVAAGKPAAGKPVVHLRP